DGRAGGGRVPGWRGAGSAAGLGALLLCLGAAALAAPASVEAGYTHYWTWQAAPADGPLRASIAEMKRLAEARPDLVKFEGSERSITLNGIGDGEHEPFTFPGDAGLNRTKTQWKPYDAVVPACLLVARDHFAPSILEIDSDGQYDGRYWAAGGALYTRVLGRTPKNLGGAGLSATLTRWTGPWFALLHPLLLGGLACFLFARRGCGAGTSWTTFYLFWFLGPMLISLLSSYPA